MPGGFAALFGQGKENNGCLFQIVGRDLSRHSHSLGSPDAAGQVPPYIG